MTDILKLLVLSSMLTICLTTISSDYIKNDSYSNIEDFK